ncbi:hypothetical protein BTJ40_05735 [Microbulbifer sp. A4B17]|nr:hypothetical protein BTJ40_05735 [Microbulbifer sp. A4B17]
MPKGLPFQQVHYLALVDWSGRHLAPKSAVPFLKRRSLSLSGWASQQNTGSISVGTLKAALKVWWD